MRRRLLSTPTRRGPAFVGHGEAEAHRLAGPGRHVDADIGRLEAGRIARRGVEGVDQRVTARYRELGEEVDRRGRPGTAGWPRARRRPAALGW